MEMVSHTETCPGKQGTSVRGRAGYSKLLNLTEAYSVCFSVFYW